MFLGLGIFPQLCVRIGQQQMPALRRGVQLQCLLKRLRRCRSLIHLHLNIAQSKQGALLRSEEHTSELQSPYDLVCRLLLEKKKKKQNNNHQADKNYNQLAVTRLKTI